MQGILENDLIMDSLKERNRDDIGTKIGVFGKIFGCWHKRLTRPFSERNVSYRACLECGARKNFNTQSFTMVGSFYYPASAKPLLFGIALIFLYTSVYNPSPKKT